MSETPLNGETRYRLMMRRRYRNLFDALEDSITQVAEMLKAWKQPEAGLSLYENALVLLLARGHNAAAGVAVLAERGFGELAMSVCRLLAEAMVSAHWMSLKAEDRAFQFRRFGELERLELGDLLKELDELKDEQIPAPYKDPAYVAALRKEFRDKSGWMQRGMGAIIRDIEPLWKTPAGRKDFLATMKILHLTGDRHSHIGASDTVRFRSERGVALGPTEASPTWAAQALKQAAWCYLQLADLAVKELRLMDIGQWNGLFQETMARCSWLRREQVEGLNPESACPCGSRLPYKRCHEGVDLLDLPEAVAD
jgi:Family of unknown function (DUF5677)/SEC-C motif